MWGNLINMSKNKGRMINDLPADVAELRSLVEREEEEEEQQIQEINLLSDQDSHQCIISADVENLEDFFMTMPKSENLISTVASPVQPIQPLIPPLAPTGNMNVVPLPPIS